MKLGVQTVKIKDYGFNIPKEGKDPSAMVQFINADGESIMWFGSFKEGEARRITQEIMVNILEFNGKTGQEFALGIGSGVINEHKDYEINVVEHEWEGKKSNRVKWIRDPNAKAEKLDPQAANAFVGGLNMAGDFAALRAKKEQKDLLTKPSVPNMAPQTADNIPF